MTTVDPGFLLSGRYRIEELIGRGSQSSVYRATDEVLGRDVAIKLFRDGAVYEIAADKNAADKNVAGDKAADDEAADSGRPRRQNDEVRILAGMAHHALVTLFDAGADLSDPNRRLDYLVMELVRGPDLRRRSAEGPLSAAHMALIGHDLADGLAHIHHHGIIHRDVKPANILLVDYSVEDRRPRAKLSDFGVAITLREGHRGDPDDSSGTPAYLSPEQAAGEPAGPASDVYSLGLVLLEGLTGRRAYPGAPVQSALARLLHDPDIPEELAPLWVALLTSMLDREPAARPPAREVSLALRQEVINGAGRHRRNAAPLLTDEEGRMQAVGRYGILDTPADGAFDRIAALAARMFSVPVAIVSVVDHDRIWFKAHHGTDVTAIGRDPGLCASAIMQGDAWVVRDATKDPRTLSNPLVAGEFGLQFYAGVPLRTPDGYNLGTFCILDREPREFSDEDTSALEDLAALVMHDLELRLHSRRALAG